MNIKDISHFIIEYKKNPRKIIIFSVLAIFMIMFITLITSTAENLSNSWFEKKLTTEAVVISYNKLPDLQSSNIVLGNSKSRNQYIFVVPVKNVTSFPVILRSISLHLDTKFELGKTFGKREPCATHETAEFEVDNQVYIASALSKSSNIVDLSGNLTVDQNKEDSFPIKMSVTIGGCGIPFDSDSKFAARIEFPVAFSPMSTKNIVIRIPKKIMINRSIEKGIYEYIDLRDIPKFVTIDNAGYLKVAVSANGKANILSKMLPSGVERSNFYDSKTNESGNLW